MLPFGMTIESFKAGGSRICNPAIAWVFRELGLMEEWGSGYRRFIAACDQGGYPYPEWTELGAAIRVVFLPHPEVAALPESRLEPQVGTKSRPSADSRIGSGRTVDRGADGSTGLARPLQVPQPVHSAAP